MSEHEPEQTDTASDGSEGIGDDQLPADLRPSEDNPLARHPDQTGDEDDRIGADTESEPQTAPLTEEDGAYGHDDTGGGGVG